MNTRNSKVYVVYMYCCEHMYSTLFTRLVFSEYYSHRIHFILYHIISIKYWIYRYVRWVLPGTICYLFNLVSSSMNSGTYQLPYSKIYVDRFKKTAWKLSLRLKTRPLIPSNYNPKLPLIITLSGSPRTNYQTELLK